MTLSWRQTSSLGVVAIATSSSRISSNSLAPFAIFCPSAAASAIACSGLIRMGLLASLMTALLSGRAWRPAGALERPQFAAQLRDRLVDVVEFGAGRVAEHLTVELG